ncbi:tRNA (adenosine(37)-N6)-threonylcarbamoyltransferase complex ATPase subunit type 1 TsaE [Kibdelosporangium philippinense]|uniref:tRNA threonylcarbamoyladenosine biosynthesis protein TsaE n=1 Tax=Kibdelosporangium philippinense TaxID=211113 RepID=A0ABS8ZDF6_9PSEU|nr:tRNA (adenosine(37)-N6)-threonylcarbamoyltransferase complex ATPase subunit type 1 TsaE [Kibdelosporangium philippinense]MCE7005810.1 tRNA (adenosine(37)-N6)-threonylcarbamoyltransferase complex ATPase subunit type 1 TsaE [Kibdelosporangium philippinense]
MISLPTVDDTVEFGQKLGKLLGAGDLVLLAGPLGAGKTVLVRGIAAGLGVKGRVSSPTFVIERVHKPGSPDGVALVHVDAYRLIGHVEEVDDLDLDSDLTTAAVVIEWGEGLAEQLAEDFLLVRLERRPDDTRVATVEPHGTWTTRVESLVSGYQG